MPTVSSNQTITLPQGSIAIFRIGGSGTVTVDPAGRGNQYTVGNQEAFIGPFDRAYQLYIAPSYGSLTYVIDSDGDLADQSDPIARINDKIANAGLQKGPLSMLLAPAADVPTIADGASSGWGGGAINCDDARFTYWGGASIAPDSGGFGQMKSKNSSSIVGNQPFFTEFGLDGTSVVIRCGVDTGKTKWLIWVDGKLAQANTEFLSATVGTRDITITFAASRPRIITILSTWGAHKYTPGNSQTTIYKVERSKGRRVALVGDSWGDVGGEILDGWGYHLALQLGYSDIVPSYQGGTGYYATGTAGQGRRSFVGRFADEIGRYGYDDVIVNGSINDLPSALPGIPRADVVSAASAFFDLAAKNGRLVVFGCQYIDPTLTSQYDAINAELQQALAGRGEFYSSNGWLSGTGRIGATSGSGNRDVYRLADGNHVNAAGGRYWAGRMYERVSSVLY